MAGTRLYWPSGTIDLADKLRTVIVVPGVALFLANKLRTLGPAEKILAGYAETKAAVTQVGRILVAIGDPQGISVGGNE
jgi:hypothetical protein